MVEANGSVGPGRHLRRIVLLGWCASLAGCPDDEGAPACLELDVEACAPLYPPRFDQVYTETLEPRCSVAGGSCHANPEAIGAAGGFWFDTPERAHDILLEERAAGPWVIPGDAQCSPLMHRLDSDDPFFVMPPGSQPMSLGVRCSIAQWIEGGARGPGAE
jgi:hypothetical protein